MADVEEAGQRMSLSAGEEETRHSLELVEAAIESEDCPVSTKEVRFLQKLLRYCWNFDWVSLLRLSEVSGYKLDVCMRAIIHSVREKDGRRRFHMRASTSDIRKSEVRAISPMRRPRGPWIKQIAQEDLGKAAAQVIDLNAHGYVLRPDPQVIDIVDVVRRAPWHEATGSRHGRCGAKGEERLPPPSPGQDDSDDDAWGDWGPRRGFQTAPRQQPPSEGRDKNKEDKSRQQFSELKRKQASGVEFEITTSWRSMKKQKLEKDIHTEKELEKELELDVKAQQLKKEQLILDEAQLAAQLQEKRKLPPPTPPPPPPRPPPARSGCEYPFPPVPPSLLRSPVLQPGLPGSSSKATGTAPPSGFSNPPAKLGASMVAARPLPALFELSGGRVILRRH